VSRSRDGLGVIRDPIANDVIVFGLPEAVLVEEVVTSEGVELIQGCVNRFNGQIRKGHAGTLLPRSDTGTVVGATVAGRAENALLVERERYVDCRVGHDRMGEPEVSLR